MNTTKLIVIDDEPSMAEYVSDVAESAGFQTTQYHHAVDFLDKHDDDAAAIVLDLIMPDFDGVELIRLLADMQTKAALVLISGLDASVLKSASELAQEHGLNLLGTLQKPFHPQELKDLLNNVSIAPTKEKAVHTKAPEEKPLELDDLRRAIEQRELIGYYQPQIAIKDKRLVGFEALMRWQHPELGIVPPGSFIPMAEESGLINEMTWLLFEQISDDWTKFGLEQSVSINMTAGMFKHLNLPEKLRDIGNKYGFTDHSQVTLEITESAVMEELTKSLDNLTRLRMKGFQLSIDDFGTGYSSLVQLYRAPFSELKIDRSFIMKLEEDAEAQAIVEATILLAHKLKIKVVAEGVENESILNRLGKLDCDIAQGFHIARPMPGSQLLEWIEQSSYGNKAYSR